jgi:protein TonB
MHRIKQKRKFAVNLIEICLYLCRFKERVMKRMMVLVVLGLVANCCLIQAQDEKVTTTLANQVLLQIDPVRVDTSKVYSVVDQMPQYPGGETEMFNFIHKNLRYPISAAESSIQGKVICKFIVEIDGTITKPEVILSLDPDFDKEALRVINLFPKFIPGKQNGKNVRVWYTIPFIFRLEK